MGTWINITPPKLPKKDSHRWVFAIYFESPSERGKNCWYQALLFRDEGRTVFGKKEYAELVHYNSLRQFARRVVADKVLRDSLLSDDPDLPKLWKRH